MHCEQNSEVSHCEAYWSRRRKSRLAMTIPLATPSDMRPTFVISRKIAFPNDRADISSIMLSITSQSPSSTSTKCSMICSFTRNWSTSNSLFSLSTIQRIIRSRWRRVRCSATSSTLSVYSANNNEWSSSIVTISVASSLMQTSQSSPDSLKEVSTSCSNRSTSSLTR